MNPILHNDVMMANVDRAINSIALQLGVSAEEVRQNCNREHLKLIKAIPGTGVSLELNPVAGNDTLLPTEAKISNTEVAVVVAAGFTISKAAGTTALSNFGQRPHFTYPDPKFFVGTKSGEDAEYLQLLRLYNGTIEFINGTKIHATLNASRCLFVPQSTYDTSPVDLAQFGPGEAERGMFPMYPQFFIDGGEKSRIKINPAEGAGTIMDGSTVAAGTANSADRNVIHFWLDVIRYTKPNNAAKCEAVKV